MKVYIITREPFPNGMAGTNRIKCYAKALISRGVECVVLNYTRTEVYGKKIQNIDGNGIFEGIPFKYIGGTPLRGCNVILRRINDYLDKERLKRYLKKVLHPKDVVFGYAGQDVNYIISIINIAHDNGAYFVRDLCELPYGTRTETLKAIKGRKAILEQQFPLCDGIISISEALQNLAKIYVNDNCKLQKIPILVDYEQYKLEDFSSEVNTPYIFHSGTLYEQKDGILGMIEAFGIAVQQLKSPLNFISTSKIEYSPHASEIKKLIEKYNLDERIRFTGYLTNAELKQYLSHASLVIINKYQTQQNYYCFSTKLGEYFAAGKPVIITNVGEAMNWLMHKKNAYIVEPSNVEKLSQAIIYLISDSNERFSIAKNGRELCKQSFDYRVYGELLESFFYRLKR